ncbi:hypothetical protein [Nocardia sp. NPDC056564]
MDESNVSPPQDASARIVAERGDGARVVAVGPVCVVIDHRDVDAAGRYTVPPADLPVLLLDSLLARPGFRRREEAAPHSLLTPEQRAEMRRRATEYQDGRG